MAEIEICPAGEAPARSLDSFLTRSFGETKARFLRRNGDWLHRGGGNRWVLLDGGKVAGYCGVIPSRCAVGGEPQRALWWMDLVIAPEYRGRGLQTRFDEVVRDQGALLLGFPNSLAARIHRKHGWGVRDDLRTLFLPLILRRTRRVRRAEGARGTILRLSATALRPLEAGWRAYLRRYRPQNVYRLEEPDFEELAAVAEEHLHPHYVTTWRSAPYLRWRYGEAPYRDRIAYHVCSETSSPQLVLISRRTGVRPTVAERWLDLFGDVGNRRLLDDLVRSALRAAVRDGVAQITVLTASTALRKTLRRHGFVLGAKARFCWLAADTRTMDDIAAAPHHWCLGDSDNDEPVRDLP